MWSKWWLLAWLAVVAAAGGAVGVVHAVVIAQVAFVYRGAAGFFLFLGCSSLLRFGSFAKFLAFVARLIHPLPGWDVTVLRASSACGVSRR